MKKGVVFAFISIIVILSTIICFFVFNNKDNDKKRVEHLSNQKYAEDVVANGEMKKYDMNGDGMIDSADAAIILNLINR